MKIMVLGGDGFCGLTTSLHLSNLGHDVLIVDNLSRRDIDNELELLSLTPILFIRERIKAWKEISGKTIQFHNIDIAKEYDLFYGAVEGYKPDTIIHFA